MKKSADEKKHAKLPGMLEWKLSYMQIQVGLDATKIVSEYDQEIPQSQTADNPVALRGRAA